MLNKLNKMFVFALVCLMLQPASARELPDFTDLVEKQGAAVVNISATQIPRSTQVLPGVPIPPQERSVL